MTEPKKDTLATRAQAIAKFYDTSLPARKPILLGYWDDVVRLYQHRHPEDTETNIEVLRVKALDWLESSPQERAG